MKKSSQSEQHRQTALAPHLSALPWFGADLGDVLQWEQIGREKKLTEKDIYDSLAGQETETCQRHSQ